jgi:hypothetical protein
MRRGLVMLLLLGAVWVAMTVHREGVDRAFGGVLARFASEGSAHAGATEPAPRRPAADSWEERTPPRPIGQGMRERVERSFDYGTQRHGGASD